MYGWGEVGAKIVPILFVIYGLSNFNIHFLFQLIEHATSSYMNDKDESIDERNFVKETSKMRRMSF